MSKARDIGDSAAVINFLDGSTSNIQTQLDNISVTSGSLTKTFAAGEIATISLGGNVVAPSLAVTKEVAQTGVTNNAWDAAASTYTLENSAPATTLDFSYYDLASAAYSSKSFGTPQEANAQGVAFKSDGTKMYVTGIQDSHVHQYSLSTAFDVSTASYDSVNVNIYSKDTQPTDVTFKTDGLEMYVVGNQNGNTYQYTLTTGWDLSTASYTRTLTSSSQDNDPQGIKFNTGGTRMFIVGDSNNAVLEYELSTAWDISSASYTDMFSVSSQGTSPTSLAFNDTGKKMFVLDTQHDSIFQYNLTAAFDVSTSSYSNVSFNAGGEDNQPRGLCFNNDGTKFYIAASTNDKVFEYDMTGSSLSLGSGSFAAADVGKTIYANSGSVVLTSTAGAYTVLTALASTNQVASGSWTMNGAVYDATADVIEPSNLIENYKISGTSASEASFYPSSARNAHGVIWNGDGTKLYIVNSNYNFIHQYPYASADDLSTASTASATNFGVGSQDNQPHGIAWSADGTRLFMLGNQNGNIYQYNASTAYDVTSLTYSSSFSVSSQDNYGRNGICISTDGTKIWITTNNNMHIYEYSLSTANLITSASYTTSLSLTSIDNQPYGIAISPDGTKLFVSGKQNDKIYQWSLSTPNTLSSASYVGASPSLSAFTTAPEGICFNADGSKIYIGSATPFGYVFQCSTQNIIAATSYQPAIASTIDSTYWTDINSLTATNAVGDGNAFYAISNDAKANWSILDNSNGVRKIVKNNSGTYQVNTNSTYGSETWANAAINTEVAALKESMESASAVSAQYDISTGVLVDYFSVNSQDTSPYGFCFSATGHKMYVSGMTSKNILEYSLSTNFDTSTASYTAAFNILSQDNSPDDVKFNNDGTKMFFIGDQNNNVYEYGLSTAWDVTSATLSSTFLVGNYQGDPWGITFNSDGTKMITIGVNGLVVEWALSTGFDISTGTYVRQYSTSGQLTYATGVEFNADGTKMFVIDNGGQDVLTYTLTTGFDISTASFTARFQVNRGGLSKIRVNTDGTKMFLLNYAYQDVGEYTLGTTDYVNQMTGTQLNAINDASQITLGSALDFATILYYASGSTLPTYSGTAINYDANVLNNGAILGTDYNYDAPAQNKVRITSVNSANLKIRVV